MTKTRLEAFSDGVLAIIITIMVLELKTPHGHEVESLRPLIPVLISYVLSFVNVGIYWNNHHHMFHAVRQISGGVLWANLHLLFWLSLLPFATGWMGESGFARLPVVAYGLILILAATAYSILVRALIAVNGHGSALAVAVGRDSKGNISLLLYAVGIVAAWFVPLAGFGFYTVVAIIWLVPDRRIENVIAAHPSEKD